MKVHYQIISKETGVVMLKNRKIAVALGWWLKENGFSYRHCLFIPRSFYLFTNKAGF
jgi:hypothetical protein